MDTTTQLWLLKIRSLIADKDFIVATANHELSKGYWLSDHKESINLIDQEIETITENIQKYSI